MVFAYLKKYPEVRLGFCWGDTCWLLRFNAQIQFVDSSIAAGGRKFSREMFILTCNIMY